MMKQFPLVVNLEVSTNKGEDAHLIFPENPENADFLFLGVFDGLGGRSAGYNGLTGGKIASSETADCIAQFLKQNTGKLTELKVTYLQRMICDFLKEKADHNMPPSKLRGSLAGKRLCTTLAMTEINQTKPEDQSLTINCTWIGDSRLYFFSSDKGLQQLTTDDLSIKKDAFEMIREDPPMSQYLTADFPPNWQINFKSYSFEENGCILACTDGCFQYLPTPWDFEKLLLETLQATNNMKDWEFLLKEKYEKIKQDDVSLILYPLNFPDFASLKLAYQERYHYLQTNFNSEEKSYDDLVQLWQSYRDNYEFYLRKSPSVEELPLETANSKEEKETLRKGEETLIKETEISGNSELEKIEVNETDRKIKELWDQAEVYREKGDYYRATSIYLEILKLDPNTIGASWNLALAYTNIFQHKQAIPYFYQVFKHDRDRALDAIIEIYKICQKYSYSAEYRQQFVQYYREAFDDPNIRNKLPLDSLEFFLETLIQLREYEYIISIIPIILEQYPNNAYAYYCLALGKKTKIAHDVSNEFLEEILKDFATASKYYQEEYERTKDFQFQTKIYSIKSECSVLENQLKRRTGFYY